MINKSIISKLLFVLCLLMPSIVFSQFEAHFHDHQSLINHNDNPTLIAAVPAFFPPFYYTNQEGTPYGMAIEVLNELDHDSGYLTKYIIKKSWKDVFKAIESGEAQVIPNLGITEERKKLYFFTKPYAKTDITIFTHPSNKIHTANALTNLRIGVVNKNVGQKIAQQRNLKDIHNFDTVNLAFQALVEKKIDAIIYPKIIIKNAAIQLDIKHLVYDTGVILKTIHRALAVSKKHPEIFKKLNTAFNKYIQTQNFKDTYVAWYGTEKNTFTKIHLIVINLFVLIFTIIFFNYFWKKKKLSALNNIRGKGDAKWVLLLILILISATSIVSLSTIWILYETSFKEQRLRLVDNVKSRARLIEAVSRYDEDESKKYSYSISEANTRTIKQIITAHKNFHGFGETGEFTLAQVNSENIEFVLRQRHSSVDKPQPISFNSERATPMRLALLGHSGTVIGKDYRGEDVLAAYEPVSVLNMGIVAKIDLAEIREPFIRSALYVLSIVIVISLFGTLLVFYIILPIIRKIKETEQRFYQLFLDNRSAILLVDAKNATIIDANTAAIEFYGYTTEELQSYKINVLSTDPALNTLYELQQLQNNKSESLITQHRLQNGEIRDIEIIMSPVKIEDKFLFHCVISDITDKLKKEKEHKRLEKDLVQARKMEALGQLTGGIAHDFNNMLGVIMGYTELSREKINDDPKNKIPGYLDKILTASNHAKELISSMMLFSRTDEGINQAINISPLVKEDVKMLRSIIPTSVEIISHVDEKLPSILIEPVKLQQLIMNLCVNARDAMDAQGTLTIGLTYQRDLNNDCLICYEHFDGDWVELSISDTGSGMSKEVKQHLFEPFFTTKAKHKGTGMGMAVVHGIVQDLNAHILIDSEIDKGTSIRILFRPINNEDELITTAQEIAISKDKHHEKILIVDDEENLSNLTGDILEIYGYECSCFSSSTHALDEFTQNPSNFDLIFSDQTMPNLTGLEMIKKMRKIRPNIPAIIVTGYSDSIDEVIAKKYSIELLRKPVEKDTLVQTVNDVLSSE